MTYGTKMKKSAASFVEMALVVFYTHGSYSGCLVQQTGWTTNLDRFWQWVSRINFTGGGFGDAAIAEGLAEALLMCCPTPVASSVPQVTERQKHCILVAASNPHRLPTPISRPPVQVQGLQQASANSDPSAAEHWWLADADTVAKAFSQCSVSLSVISPRDLNLLKTIFNTANKRNPRAPDPAMNFSKYSHHLVLLSETFVEARQALSHTSGGPSAVVPPIALPKVEASSVTSLPGAPQTPAISVRVPPTAGRPGTANGIIPAVAVKTEVSSVPGMAAASGVSHIAPALLQNTVPVPLSMPHSSSNQESSVVLDSTVTQDFKPMGTGAAPSLRAGPVNAGSLSLLPNSAQARPIPGTSVGTNLGIPGATVSAAGLPMPGMLSSSSASNVVSSSQGLLGVTQSGLGLANSQVGMGMGLGVAQGVGLGAFGNAGNLVGNPNLGAIPAGATGNNGVSNVQVVGMGQSVTGLGQGSLSSGATQIGPSGLVIGQNVLPALGSVGVNPNTATMIPTPGISQPLQGLQSMAAVNNNALQVPATVATPPQQANAAQKYAKIWEGFLTGQRQGKPVSICKLEAYRQSSSPDTLAADWPNQMQIIRLITQDHMNSKNYQGKSEVLIFRTVGQHGQQGFLVQLAEKKLCAVIQLPSQTLLLASTDVKKQDRMLGMLFPLDMVVFKPQVPSQQQQQQQ
eukprot:c19625_g2_i3 orf=3-2057(-)